MEDTLINQTAKIVIKFKDDFLLDANKAESWGIDMPNILSKYISFSSKLIQKKNLTVGNYPNINPINYILSKLSHFNTVKIRYMFEEHPISVFNDLMFGNQDKNQISQQDLKELPNFYNFFIIHFVPNDCGKDFNSMMNIIMDLMYEIEFNLKLSNDNAIEYLYTTGIPVTTTGGAGSTTTPMLIPLMEIPNKVLNANQPVTMFDLEFAWDTSSTNLEFPEFNQTPFYPLDYNAIETSLYGTLPGSNRSLLKEKKEHGKKVIQLLRSKVDNTNIEGLLSNKITIKLSSIFSSIVSNPVVREGRSLIVRSLVVKEESSLLACLYQKNVGIITPSKVGSVILIEIANPPFPLEIQPAIFSLIRLATAKGLIVIEGAGNEGKNLTDKTINLGSPNYRNAIAGTSIINYDKFKTYYNALLTEFDDRYGTLPTMLTGKNDWHTNLSGAIMIGEYNLESNNVTPKKGSHSNYFGIDNVNSKIRIFGFGGGIVEDDNFGYTSAASAIIAAVVVAIQSRVVLNASQMLDLLINSGQILQFNISTPATPNNITIGRIPKWNNILTLINNIR